MASFGIFFASIATIIIGFSSDSVLAQIRFQIAIRAVPQCQNGIDDDHDGFIDYPSDLDCVSPSDTSESILVTITPPTVVCFSPSASAIVGQPVTWIAMASNGDSTYAYTWSGTENLSGSLSSVTKTYDTPGVKQASLVVESWELFSDATLCGNSVTVVSTSSSRKNWDKSSKSSWGSSVNNISSKKDANSIPALDAAPPKVPKPTPEKIAQQRPQCTIPSSESTLPDFKDYLVCNDIMKQWTSSEDEQRITQYVSRIEMLKVAIELVLKDRKPAIREALGNLTAQSKKTFIADTWELRTSRFSDIGVSGQPEWFSQLVEQGVILGLISTKNASFRPNDSATRVEALSMLMKAVCMNPSKSSAPTLAERVYETAKKNNIISKPEKYFAPNIPIIKDDLFIFVTRIDIWKNVTGGCIPKISEDSKEEIPPPALIGEWVGVSPAYVPYQIPLDEPPGTFVFLYENKYEKTYAYVIKKGWTEEMIKSKYVRVLWGNQEIFDNLLIHDLFGEKFAGDRWFIAWEMVYVTLKK